MNVPRPLWALLAAALALRVIYCWGLSPYSRAEPVFNVDNYHPLARSVRASGSLYLEGRPSAKREPLYPIVLAAAYAAGGERYDAVWVMHCLLGAATVALVFALGVSLFGPTEAWLAAGLAAVYPQFIYYTAFPGRETFLTFLFPAALWASLALLRSPSRLLLAGAAALWAALPLTNTAFLPAAALSGPALWLAGRGLGRDLRGWALALSVGVLALWGLWPLRNALAFGRFVPGMEEGGAHIYVQFVVPNWAFGLPEEGEFLGRDPVVRAGMALPPLERDSFFYRAAVDRVLEHPLGFVKIMFTSFVKLWRLYPYARQYPGGYAKVKAVSLLSDGWLIPLGFLGLFLAGFRRPELGIVNAPLASVVGVYIVMWAVIRYRLPLMPLMLVYAAHAIVRLGARLRPRQAI